MPESLELVSRRLITIVVAGLALAGVARNVAAQNLGPFRQFLALEPYYSYLRLDGGEGASRLDLNGYGGRLWINLAPFAGPHWILPSHAGIALYTSYFPKQRDLEGSEWHYGAQYDLYFTNRPYGGIVDPFLSVAGGVFRLSSTGEAANYGTVSPGGGIRIPIPNRLQLRIDARDAIIFNTPSGIGGAKRTIHNLELQGAIGITF